MTLENRLSKYVIAARLTVTIPVCVDLASANLKTRFVESEY